MENYNEAISNADIAFANDNYESALKWYDKALLEAPKDEFALSRSGAACVALERFEEAFGYFQRALDVDPDNGDNLFNMGNAYFFSGDVVKAGDYYSKASLKQCSEDVKARIYLQLAMMCSMRGDYKAALVNYQKYEDFDPTGQASLDPEIISDKLNIYLNLEDYEGALTCASKWVQLSPSDLRAYMVYFNVLMASEQYDKALETLDDALKYAVENEDGKFAVNVSRANYYVAASGSSADPGDYDQKAYDLLNELITSGYGSVDEKNELVLALAELCIKRGSFDEAIELIQMIEATPETEAPVHKADADYTLTPDEVGAMLDADMVQVDAMIANGEIDPNSGDNAVVNYDENGNEIREYSEEMFNVPKETIDVAPLEDSDTDQVDSEITTEFRDRVNFLLLSCYAAKGDYEKALEYSKIVKHNPDNVYYSYFGRYSEAFCMMKIAKNGGSVKMADAERKYQEVIAFFRGAMLKVNEESAPALVFRTRMYAELGKYDQAEELSDLMSASDKAAIMEYIEQCRSHPEVS